MLEGRHVVRYNDKGVESVQEDSKHANEVSPLEDNVVKKVVYSFRSSSLRKVFVDTVNILDYLILDEAFTLCHCAPTRRVFHGWRS